MQQIGQLSIREQWNSSTSKPSKLLTVTGCRKYDSMTPQHSAILRSPPHTPGLGPLVANLVFIQKDLRNALVDFKRLGPRPGGRDRSRLAGISFVVLPSKPDFWNPANNWHSTETCRISLIQNLEKRPRNPRFHSASTYSMTYSWIGSIWQLNSIRDERWNYSTSKPAKLLTVKGCRKHYIMTCCSIQPSPPHTRPWRPRRQSGCCPNRCLQQRRLSSVPRPRPGGSDRLRLASRSWFLPSKPDHWNPTNNSHSTETYRISLILNLEKNIQKSTVSFSIYIQLDRESLTTPLGPTWTMKLEHSPNHTNFSLSKDVENMTSWHATAFSDSAEPTTHQALVPSSPIWLLYKRMFVTDPFIFSASAKAWRQRQIKVGISFVVSTVKTWSLKSHEQFTFNWEISNLSDSKLGKTIPIQHLHICWQLNSIRDEWWNYSTSKPSLSLSQDVRDMTSSIKSPQHSAEPATHQD